VLVVLFTDLLDPDTAAAVLARTALLRPRHLPLIASLSDDELERAAIDVPAGLAGAYVRPMAARLVTSRS